MRATTAGRSVMPPEGVDRLASNPSSAVVIIDKKVDGAAAGDGQDQPRLAMRHSAAWAGGSVVGGMNQSSSGHFVVPVGSAPAPSQLLLGGADRVTFSGNYQAASSSGAVVGASHGAAVPLRTMVWQRLSVLVMLLLLQSTSQFVMEAYESLISANIIIPLFLTMLVGAGGNAGNQAAVHSITGLVTGEYRISHMWQLLRKEIVAGLVSSSCLFCIAFVRVYFYYSGEDVQPTPVFTTVFSISLSLFIIVLTSVVIGSMLPFLLAYLRINVEHAAPMIQVLMDILGVCISCFTCSLFLPSTASGNGGTGPVAEAAAVDGTP